MSANHILAHLLMTLRSGCDGTRAAQGEKARDEALGAHLFQVC
jgi:hypothetical protein